MDNLKIVWGEVIFRVTGLHTSGEYGAALLINVSHFDPIKSLLTFFYIQTKVGNAAIAAQEPFFVNFRMNKEDKGKVVGNRDVMAGVATITALTVPAPGDYPCLNHDWRHAIHDTKSDAYAQLKFDLETLGEAVDKRNSERRFVSRDFHPDYTAISVFS